MLALFTSEILLYIVDHIASKNKIFAICILTCMGIGISIINMYTKIRLPWCIDISLVSFLLLYVGTFYKKHCNNKITQKQMILGVFLSIVGVLTGLLNYCIMKALGFHMLRVDMLYMNYGVFPLFFVSASLISIGIFNISKWIYNHTDFSFIEHIGRISLLIMVVHLYVIQILGVFVNDYLAIFFATCIISVPICLFIEKFMPFLYKLPRRK